MYSVQRLKCAPSRRLRSGDNHSAPVPIVIMLYHNRSVLKLNNVKSLWLGIANFAKVSHKNKGLHPLLTQPLKGQKGVALLGA